MRSTSFFVWSQRREVGRLEYTTCIRLLVSRQERHSVLRSSSRRLIKNGCCFGALSIPDLIRLLSYDQSKEKAVARETSACSGMSGGAWRSVVVGLCYRRARIFRSSRRQNIVSGER